MRRVLLPAALLLLPLAFVACGDDHVAPADPGTKAKEEEIPVSPWAEEDPLQPQDPGTRKEYVKLELPTAVQARTFDHRSALVANLLPDGSLVFKGVKLLLGEGTPEEREVAVAAMREELSAHLKQEARPLLIHADRLVPWSVASTVITEAMDLETPPTKIAVAAFRPPDGWEHALGGTWQEAGARTAADRDAVPVSLGFRPGEPTPSFHMTVGRDNWTLGRVPASFNDARFLEAMNRTWRKVADYLQTEVRGEKHATLAIQPNENGVWLAHVVTMLDLLASAGIEEVLFPVEGLRLRFEGR